jgi:membrane glycosyltransferase
MHPIANPIVNSKIAAPKIAVMPNSNSVGLLTKTAFIFEAINEIEDPKAKIVEPASLSEIWYLKP